MKNLIEVNVFCVASEQNPTLRAVAIKTLVEYFKTPEEAKAFLACMIAQTQSYSEAELSSMFEKAFKKYVRGLEKEVKLFTETKGHVLE